MENAQTGMNGLYVSGFFVARPAHPIQTSFKGKKCVDSHNWEVLEWVWL